MRLIWLALVVTACGALSVPSATVDAGGFIGKGMGGGTGDGGGEADAGHSKLDAGQVFDAGEGERVDGGGTADAGQAVDAGGAMHDAGAMAVDSGSPPPDAGSLKPFVAESVKVNITMGGNKVLGLSGREGEVYAVTDWELLRSTGGPFDAVPLTSLISNPPAMRAVYVAPDGAVFALAQREVFWCKRNCAGGGAAFSSTQLAAADDGVALCGQSASRVFAVFEDRNEYNRAMLWAYDGDIWRNTSVNLGLSEPGSCALTASGKVVIAAEGGVILYDDAGGSSMVLHPDVPPLTSSQAANHRWYATVTRGEEIWVLGQSRRSLHRDAAGTWAFYNPNEAAQIHYAVALISANEIYGAGGSTPETALRRFDGTTWSLGPSLSTVQSVRAVYVAGPNLIYFGGFDRLVPAIDRLTR